MIWSMRVFRISPVVRGVLVTMVFQTCTAACRTVYPTSALAMNSSASTCTTHRLQRSMPDRMQWTRQQMIVQNHVKHFERIAALACGEHAVRWSVSSNQQQRINELQMKHCSKDVQSGYFPQPSGNDTAVIQVRSLVSIVLSAQNHKH